MDLLVCMCVCVCVGVRMGIKSGMSNVLSRQFSSEPSQRLPNFLRAKRDFIFIMPSFKTLVPAALVACMATLFADPVTAMSPTPGYYPGQQCEVTGTSHLWYAICTHQRTLCALCVNLVRMHECPSVETARQESRSPCPCADARVHECYSSP